MKELKALGKKVAAARKARAMTQEDLAGAAEIDRSYISEVENGHKNISVLALIKIAKALRLEAKEFF